MKYAFESTSLNFEFTGSADQALQMFDKNQYLAVISDFNLHEGDALVLLKEVRRRNPKIPFIFVSGDSSLHRENLIQLGATDFFLKPIKMSEFRKYLLAQVK